MAQNQPIISVFLKLFVKSNWRGKAKGEETNQCIAFWADIRAALLEQRLRAIVLHIPNEFGGGKNKTFGALLYAMGKVAGAPDYVFIWDGGALCLEFKSPGKDLNPNQRLFKQWCEWAGIPYFKVYSAAEAKSILFERKVIKM